MGRVVGRIGYLVVKVQKCGWWCGESMYVVVKYIISYNGFFVKRFFQKKEFSTLHQQLSIEKAIPKVPDFSFRTVKNLLFIIEENDKGVYEFVVCGRFCAFVFAQ